MRALLRFYVSVMSSGKSTVALQLNHNLAGGGLKGQLLVKNDREGPQITSRLGIAEPALELSDSTDIDELLSGQMIDLDYVVVDEAQFLTPEQVEQLARLVDDHNVDVYAFGLLVDFRSELFPGTRRLLELADERLDMQVQPRCWCGHVATQNARTVAGRMTVDGDQVLVGDTDDGVVAYELLCRRHYLRHETRAIARTANRQAV